MNKNKDKAKIRFIDENDKEQSVMIPLNQASRYHRRAFSECERGYRIELNDFLQDQPDEIKSQAVQGGTSIDAELMTDKKFMSKINKSQEMVEIINSKFHVSAFQIGFNLGAIEDSGLRDKFARPWDDEFFDNVNETDLEDAVAQFRKEARL